MQLSFHENGFVTSIIGASFSSEAVTDISIDPYKMAEIL